MVKKDFDSPEYYYNRELSWIKFNRRVLLETEDDGNPLMEKFGFLSITASNLDEFYMVRVASLSDMELAGYHKKDPAGMTAEEQLLKINKENKKFAEEQYRILNTELLPELRAEGVDIITSYEDLTEEQSEFADQFFSTNVYPVLTPMAVDASRPFPLVRNKTLNIAALIRNNPERQGLIKHDKKGDPLEFATVQVPSVLPRLVQVPSHGTFNKCYCLLEQIIEKNLDKLYLNYDVVAAFPYRIMRNADFELEEEESIDLMKELEKQLKKRDWGRVIRLEVEEGIDKKLLSILKENLDISDREIFRINGPIDLTFLSKIPKIEDRPDLYFDKFYPAWNPRIPRDGDIFAAIRKEDILLQHPYESFDPVVDFIKNAADDPKVLAIKQTLYRVSGNSPIVAALARAAENGKQVTVLVELKARFDEEHNIVWAKKLEHAGCHVIYGVVGLKTHCKIALVVRHEDDGIRRYVHLATGNYNDSTAKHYTDNGILTCAESFGRDATALFNMLSGYSEPEKWNKFVVAPLWMRKKFYALIDREIEHAKEGREGRIVAKMNSLCDPGMIAKLYEASSSGVKIDLIIRGICTLKTGIPGVSDNIHVYSIVGEFLEHARIFYFYNDSQEDIFMGSADWMGRNLDRRIELVFPIEDTKIKEELKHYLDVELKDRRKAYELLPDGNYIRRSDDINDESSSQAVFVREARERAEKKSLKNRI